MTLFDSPGLGADDVEEDLHNLQQILNLIKDLRKMKTEFTSGGLKGTETFQNLFSLIYIF